VVNVIKIDKAVRKYVVPLFGEYIRGRFAAKELISVGDAGRMLKQAWQLLNGKFGTGRITSLRLELNPFRKIAIDSEDSKKMIISEKFEFAATHTLWNENFPARRILRSSASAPIRPATAITIWLKCR